MGKRAYKVWAAVEKSGKLRHVRQADYREPVATLKWLGYQAATLTIDKPKQKKAQRKWSNR